MNASLCNLLYVKSIDISTQNKIFKAQFNVIILTLNKSCTIP